MAVLITKIPKIIRSPLFLLLLFPAGCWVVMPRLWQFPLVQSLLIAVTAVLIYFVENSFHQARLFLRTHRYQKGGLLYRLLIRSGSWGKIWRGSLAGILGMWWVLQFPLYTSEEWVAFLVAMILFYYCQPFVRALVAREMVQVLIRSYTLKITRRIVSSIGYLLFVLYYYSGWGTIKIFPNWGKAIEAEIAKVPQSPTIIKAVYYIFGYAAATKSYFAGWLADSFGILPAAFCMSLGEWMLFFVSSTLAAGFLLLISRVKNGVAQNDVAQNKEANNYG